MKKEVKLNFKWFIKHLNEMKREEKMKKMKSIFLLMNNIVFNELLCY